MNPLLLDLLSLAEDHFPPASTEEVQTCQRLKARQFGAASAAMGAENAQKLRDAVEECAQLEREAAFLQGLRLGLALHRL